MQSHPRSTIHSGLEGEVHMHNGKNNPHYWMEKRAAAGHGGVLPPEAAGAARPLFRQEAASGSRPLRLQLGVVAGRCESTGAHGRLAGSSRE